MRGLAPLEMSPARQHKGRRSGRGAVGDSRRAGGEPRLGISPDVSSDSAPSSVSFLCGILGLPWLLAWPLAADGAGEGTGMLWPARFFLPGALTSGKSPRSWEGGPCPPLPQSQGARGITH